MKENEADSWEQVRTWLLKFRQSGISVVIVHHSNRTGNDMRGTSRREDAADWIIQVSPNFRFSNIDRGTAFTTKFTKNRDDGGTREKLLDWTFTTTGECIEVNCGETNMEGRIYELIKSGIGSNAEIAEETGITKGAVSQHIKRLTDRGFIRKEGQIYVAVESYSTEISLRK
jgi:DNA-binding transcriptional ArsR family regulator